MGYIWKIWWRTMLLGTLLLIILLMASDLKDSMSKEWDPDVLGGLFAGYVYLFGIGSLFSASVMIPLLITHYVQINRDIPLLKRVSTGLTIHGLGSIILLLVFSSGGMWAVMMVSPYLLCGCLFWYLELRRIQAAGSLPVDHVDDAV